MAAETGDDNFLATFRHDCRTPLHTILGFAQMLREQPLSDTANRYVEHIEQAGQQLARLVDELPNEPPDARPVEIDLQPFEVTFDD